MKLPQCFGSAVGSGCTCLPDVGCNYKHKLPAPAPEPKCYHCETCRKQCSPKTGQSICCNCKSELSAPEPKQGSEEPIDFDAAAKTANAWYYANRFEVFGAGRRELARAYLALRAEVEELKKDRAYTFKKFEAELAAADQNLKTMLQTTGEEAERQLATAREEISKLREMRAPTTPTVEMVRLRQSNQNLMMLYANAIGECRKINKAIHRVLRGRNNAVKQLAAEKARADRAEERVKECLQEDAAGRSVPELLRLSAALIYNAGGGPIEDCLRLLADRFEAILARASKEGGSR